MWFLFGLGTGFLNALTTAFSKKAVESVDPYFIPLVQTLLALPVFAVAILATGFTAPTALFWPALIGSGIINVLAAILTMKALKIGDLSLTIPYLAFTPLFLVLTSRLILNESISTGGFIGILMITAGSLALQWTKGGTLKDPLRNFANNRASQLALLVAFLYSISTNLDKIGILHSDAIVYPAMIYAFQALVFLPIVIWRKKPTKTDLKKNLKFLLPIGPISTVMLLLYSAAISSAMVAYVIALKRTVVLWSVLIGCFAFNEKNFVQKIAGAAAMVCGVLLIAMG